LEVLAMSQLEPSSGDSAPSSREIGDQFEQAWDSNATLFNNIDEFLAKAGLPPADSPDGQAAFREVVKRDLELRLQAKQSIHADQYLAQYPKLTADPSFVTELREAEQERAPQADASDYEILEPLGKGGMGVVYRARQLSLGRFVALKMLLGGRPASATELQRFHLEAEAVARLEHPGIVPVYDFGEYEGHPYFSMKLIAGGSLAKRLDEFAWPEAGPARERARRRVKLLELLIPVAEAVHYAHQRGILHRDLKPGNILLDEEGRPHVTDFGLAKWLPVPGGSPASAAGSDDGALTETGVILGTPNYMAPEQAAGRPDAVATTADVYGLGAILYQLLTGKPPFREATTLETLRALVEREPVRPRLLRPNLDRDLETVCLKCLEKDPARRYGSAKELADELRRCLHGEPILARPIQPWARAGRWCRRNPVLASLSATLLLSLFAIIGLGIARWQSAVEHAQKMEEKEAVAQAAKTQAEAERDRAETAKIRAEKAEKEANDNLQMAEQRKRATMWQAAQFALARGQRAEALTLYDSLAAAVPAEERTLLRVERLPCLFLQEHWPRLHAELKELSALPLPEKLRARVLLHRGDVGLWEVTGQLPAPARHDLEEALRIPGGLNDADAAYARGLLTDSVFEAVRQYELALQHQPFHARARVALLMELVLSGQFEAAQQQLNLAVAAHREDPSVAAAGVLLSLLRHDAAAGKQHLQQLRSLLNRERFDRLASILNSLEKALQRNEDLQGFSQLNQVLAAFQLGPLLQQGPALGLASPSLTRSAQMVVALLEIYRSVYWAMFFGGDAEALCRRCEELAKKHPEGCIRLLQVCGRSLLVMQHLRANRFERSCQESVRIYDLLEEVARRPTLTLTKAYQHDADWMRALLQASWLAERLQTAALMAASFQMRPDVPGATIFNPWLPLSKHGEKLLLVPRRYDRPLVWRLAADSQVNVPIRDTHFSTYLLHFPAEDARLLLADWEADEPGKVLPLKLRAKFEEHQGEPQLALGYAERALRLAPADRELQRQRERLQKQGQRQP
jgi:serine/threonine protein kinase